MENSFSSRRSGSDNTPLIRQRPFLGESHVDFFGVNQKVFASTTSWLFSGCRWSDERLFVHVRKHHKPPSRWTKSPALLAESDFTQLILFEEKPPDGHMLSGWRLTWQELTSRPDHLWPELWTKLGRNAKLKEKHKWSHEKLQLDNARKLRGTHFMDPEDKEFKETIKNAHKKLETAGAPAMPCKISKDSQNRLTKLMRSNQNLRVSWKAVNPQEMRIEQYLPNHHDVHIAEKGDKSLQRYNLVHNFFLWLKLWKFLRQKEAADK